MMMSITKNFMPHDHSWVPKLSETFTAAGLEVMATEKCHEKDWQRQMMMHIWCLTADDFAASLPRERAERMKALSAGAGAEVRQGASYSQTFRVVLGKVRGTQ